MKLLLLFIELCCGLRLGNIKMNIESPRDIVKFVGNKNYLGEEWSNMEIYKNHIDSAAIFQNQHTILFSSDDIIHRYNYLDQTIDKILDYLNNNNIDYQVFNVDSSSSNILEIGLEIVFGYILLNILYNLIKNSNGMMKPFNNQYDTLDKNINTSFDQVAGIIEVKEELIEIVDYLKNPEKYLNAGARIPKGVLLEGPPGTGKTLLARAVAGEAEVSFISASGSSFVEMFVGIGASRVRSLFETAKKNKPCVIFIDEIDTIGGKRGYGFNSGGNDEREQTLNQLLTSIDGFEQEDGIVVLAATNRADILDPALKRSGRFDRKITVNLPNFEERKDIFNVHIKNKNIGNISLDAVSSLTSGFSGADLETLANEASLMTLKTNNSLIESDTILKAFEKMVIGLPKKEDMRPESIKKLVAVHEVGHAMMVKCFPEYFILKRITINSNTGGAGGYTLFLPHEEINNYPTKGYYLAQLIVALGGRAAEIVYYSDNQKESIIDEYSDLDITSGAASDIKKANVIANEYLKLFEDYTFDEVSDLTQKNLEDKTKKLLKKSLNKAVSIIKNNRSSFDSLIELLIEEKTLVY